MILHFQQDRYSCGSHAFSNALAVFGVEIDTDEAKRLCGTTYRGGTSERGILRALRSCGFKGTEYRGHNQDNSWRWLLKWSSTSPILLVVYENQHWCTAIGRAGDRVVVVDSDPSIQAGENGVFVLDKAELLERWRYRICYAIRVTRQ